MLFNESLFFCCVVFGYQKQAKHFQTEIFFLSKITTNGNILRYQTKHITTTTTEKRKKKITQQHEHNNNNIRQQQHILENHKKKSLRKSKLGNICYLRL